jgi:hypothetical protein
VNQLWNRVQRVVVSGLFLLLAQSFLTSCSQKQMSDGALTQSCRPFISATGKEVRESHPTKPTECKFLVALTCNACVYDDKGGLSHSVSEVCGVCFGADF